MRPVEAADGGWQGACDHSFMKRQSGERQTARREAGAERRGRLRVVAGLKRYGRA